MTNKRLDAIRQRLEASQHNQAGRYAVLNADIAYLLSLVEKQSVALKAADEWFNEVLHENDSFGLYMGQYKKMLLVGSTVTQALKCDEGGEVECQ